MEAETVIGQVNQVGGFTCAGCVKALERIGVHAGDHTDVLPSSPRLAELPPCVHCRRTAKVLATRTP